MHNIININLMEFNNEQINTVNARELHEFLEIGKKFTSWIQDRIQQYEFTEGLDFISCLPELGSKIHGGHNRKEYFITLDMAKEISMVARNQKGREARKYFINCEKQLKQNNNIDLNDPADLRGLLGNYAEKLIEAQTQIEADSPKIAAYNAFINSDTLYMRHGL